MSAARPLPVRHRLRRAESAEVGADRGPARRPRGGARRGGGVRLPAWRGRRTARVARSRRRAPYRRDRGARSQARRDPRRGRRARGGSRGRRRRARARLRQKALGRRSRAVPDGRDRGRGRSLLRGAAAGARISSPASRRISSRACAARSPTPPTSAASRAASWCWATPRSPRATHGSNGPTAAWCATPMRVARGARPRGRATFRDRRPKSTEEGTAP